ncbi:hypothetical protein [Stigmatella erecta]|uniref:Uncharacterized protein n=1 Tax=Stigmatella erecta TaxID=83460 RepID=A0A1I0LHV6_9BACT|nr:hypothetical protein [Stigmatella erecta]SEU39195.1 hypothetical protein SAMN05443639_1352 [Stigmatella erecta]
MTTNAETATPTLSACQVLTPDAPDRFTCVSTDFGAIGQDWRAPTVIATSPRTPRLTLRRPWLRAARPWSISTMHEPRS